MNGMVIIIVLHHSDGPNQAPSNIHSFSWMKESNWGHHLICAGEMEDTN